MIKNLLLDLGGVLINIDFKKVTLAFRQLGVEDFDRQFSQLSASSLFEDLERGRISDSEFYRVMQEQAGPGISEAAIRDAWNAILLDFRKESMRFLEENKEKYRIFLLSNTNDIHLRKVNEILLNQTGTPTLDQYFEKAYYSQKLGMRKPNEDIFDFVLTDAGIKAADTLFIDDSRPNIETADRLGFKTHWLLPGERIEQLALK
jgi:putative hydrolase of the HAD superfamily